MVQSVDSNTVTRPVQS